MRWADEEILAAIRPESGDAIVKEFAHVLGCDETWLARVQGREPVLAIWPDLAASQLGETTRMVHAAYESYFATLSDAALDETIAYRNSKGEPFTSKLSDILLHAALHAQYHRGKINLLLRQAGAAPAPVDYISFVRGTPAATTARS